MSEEGRLLEDACRVGLFGSLLEEYLESCRSKPEESGERKRKEESSVFPNVAGFCRYFRIGESDLQQLQTKYPEAMEQLQCVMEDEALNSRLSPTVISVYLKRRLGYEKAIAENAPKLPEQMQILFEHDAYEDGV